MTNKYLSLVESWKMAQEHHAQPCNHSIARQSTDPRTYLHIPPQVVGGTGFIVSSWLFMLETQPNWHTPSPQTLGWHIGFWNLVGALGFTLCGALGFASGSSQACETASLWSTFIGSWAFLVRTFRAAVCPGPPTFLPRRHCHRHLGRYTRMWGRAAGLHVRSAPGTERRPMTSPVPWADGQVGKTVCVWPEALAGDRSSRGRARTRPINRSSNPATNVPKPY